MAHFGILCPPSQGHINPSIILSKELKKRGNTVTFLNIIDCKDKIESAGFNFKTIGLEAFPKGYMDLLYAKLGQSSEHQMILHWNEFCLKLAEITTQEIIETIQGMDVDILIVDQIDIIGGSIAELLEIPFITVCYGLLTFCEKAIPSPFTNLPYDNSEMGIKVNEWMLPYVQKSFEPMRKFINKHRLNWGLTPFEVTYNPFYTSSLAQISQFPKALDFPREQLDKCFHYTGPFIDNTPEENIDFPYHLLDGRPIIYCSLGTLVNQKKEIFITIAKACENFDYQLIMVTTTQPVNDFLDLPGNPLVLRYVPQNKILKLAKLIITHGGVNTLLDAIMNSVPIIAIPITFDQPGCAERVKWHKIGEIVPLKQVSAERINEAILKIIHNPEYLCNVKAMKALISQIDGTIEACNIIENAAESVLEIV